MAYSPMNHTRCYLNFSADMVTTEPRIAGNNKGNQIGGIIIRIFHLLDIVFKSSQD